MQNKKLSTYTLIQTRDAFTVLELMVGIIVFTLGFLGAYLLIESASNASIRSRDEIIGANIMREQIELIKNLRDTNWIQYRSWNSIELEKSFTETDNTLKLDTFYTIANNFSSNKNISIKKLSLNSIAPESILQEFQKTPSNIRLCIDTLNRYTHDCSGGNTKTNFASFFKIEPLITKNTKTNTPITVDRAYKITIYFASYNKGYRLTNMNNIITDWKNQ